jgi:L-iditol 2-dehydrogenase
MIVPPAVFGHEFSGTVLESGPDVSGWRPGERVVAANSAPCGHCFYCKEAQENLCDDLMFVNGAYAESIILPARIVEKNLLRIGASTPFRDAALTEPLACVVQGVQDSGLRSEMRVLVIGAGPIGLMFVVLASNLGCQVTVSGRGKNRLDKARALGAAHVLDATTPEQQPQPGAFDVVIEAVGKPETWETAVRLVRKGGTVNFFGGCPTGTSISLDTALIHYSNLRLLASFHHTPPTIRRALELIESRVIRAADFIDGECGLSELPDLFRSMAKGNRAVKTAVQVRG